MSLIKLQGLGKRKQDPFPRQDLDYVRAKRARYQHATTFNAGPSSTGNIGSSSSGVAERLDLSGLRNESEMASSDHEHQSVVYPEYPTFLREFDGFDAVDSIESDVFQETASRVPEAPVARMDRQDTVGTIGRDIEPTPAANSMPNTSHGSEPQFAVPPLPSRIPARFPQSSRNIRATSEFPSSERRHQSSFYLHKKDQDSIRNLPYDAEKSTPIRRPCSTERSETSTSRRPCSTEGSETSTSTPTSNTPATEVRSRHSTPSRQMKFSVYVTPHCCKLWRLEGDFRKKTLKELVDEMREKFQLGSNFTELSLVLTISEQTFEDQVELGNERGFEDIKLRFSGKMNSHRRSVRASEGMADPVLEISFEPLWNDMAVIEEDDRGWVSSAA